MENDVTKYGTLPESVHKFYNTIGGFGNVFHIISINKDGEITDEKFGKNVFTNYGVTRRFYYSNYYDHPYSIFLGTGTSAPSLDSSTMIQQAILTGSEYTGEFRPGSGTVMPLHYDASKKVFTQAYKVLKDTFDYNVKGMDGNILTSEISLTEIGVGESNDKLLSHSLIYDESGNLSNIIKKPNEKLFITIYWQGAVSTKLIEDNFSKGIHTFIEPYWLGFPVMASAFNGMQMTYMTRARYSNNIGSVPGSTYWFGDNNNIHADDPDSNHIAKFNKNVSTDAVLYEDMSSYISGVIMAFEYRCFDYPSGYSGTKWNSDRYNFYWGNSSDLSTICAMHSFERISTPEEFEKIIYCDYWDNGTFFDTFGTMHWMREKDNINNEEATCYSRGQLPMVDADFKSLKLYNHKTKQWDIDAPFLNNPTYNYDQSMLQFPCELYIESSIGSNNGTNFIVLMNPLYRDHKITKFTDTGITVYATDTYWDISSYQLITTLSAVEDSLSQKKYYCVKTSEYTRLHAIYTTSDGIEPHKLTWTVRENIPNIILDRQYNSDYYRRGVQYAIQTKPLVSEINNWIMLSCTLIYPEAEGGARSYILYGPGDEKMSNDSELYTRWATDDRIIIASQGYYKNKGVYPRITLRVYDVSDPYNEPTYQNVTLPFNTVSTTTNIDPSCPIFSWGDDGYLCAQRFSENTCCILNVYDLDNPIKLENVTHGFLLNLSNKVVYQRTDITNVKQFQVYDIATDTVEDTFELPSDRTYTVNGIFGWKDNVYVSVEYDGILDVYYYNLTTKILQILNVQSPTPKTGTYYNSSYRQYLSNDEVFICVNMAESSSYKGETIYISAEEPTKIRLIYDESYYSSSDMRHYSGAGQLAYTDDGKNIIYLCKIGDNTNSRLISVDMGYLLDNNGEYPKTKCITTEEMVHPPWRNYDYRTQYRDMGIYKGQIYYTSASQSNDDKTLYFTSLNFTRPHKLVATTKTITSINNPFRVEGKQLQMTLTNDFNHILNYDPAVYNIIE